MNVIDLGTMAYEPAMEVQARLVSQALADPAAGATLLLVEHSPAVITMGRRAKAQHIVATEDQLARRGVKVIPAPRGGDVTWHGPGQLVAYPITRLDRRGLTLRQYVNRLEQAVIDVLEGLGIKAHRDSQRPGVWTSGYKIAAVGVAVTRWVTSHGLALNVCNDLEQFDLIVPCGLAGAGVTSISQQLGRHVAVDELKAPLAARLTEVLEEGSRQQAAGSRKEASDSGLQASGSDVQSSAAGNSQICNLQFAVPPNSAIRSPALRSPLRRAEQSPQSAIPRMPSWMRRPIAAGGHSPHVRELLDRLGLETVCGSAQCPNQGECFGRGTATFMILGRNCTRNCRFCAVGSGQLGPPRADEPQAVAQAVVELGLRHVVITSVTRDDLADGGSGHFARTINAVHQAAPTAAVEVLVPDFQGDHQAIRTVIEAGAGPAAAAGFVFNHNVETVPALYAQVRPQASYRRSLDVLEAARNIAKAMNVSARTKSGLMVGLGETSEQVEAVMADLRTVGCDILTIGQYLAPSRGHLPVRQYVEPAMYEHWRLRGLEMGFAAVASGPYVRSSYRAEEVANLH